MPRLSAFIITKNEAHDILDCLDSLQGVADEIIVVDDQSTDDTVALCRCRGAKVISRPLEGFAAQKQFALEQCTGDWVLSIDADERMTPELAREIRATAEQAGAAAGYKVKRHMYFLGHRLRFGGVGTDWVLRFFRRGLGRYRPVLVHESIRVDGAVRRLQGALDHYSYATLEEYVEKCNQYTTLAARDLYARGKRFSAWDHLRPSWELISRVILKFAWLDGQAGVTYAALSAHTSWLRVMKLREMEKQQFRVSGFGFGVESETQNPKPETRNLSFLIVRTDRMGDVLLTTPVARALREKYPKAKITWLVRPYTAPLLQNNPDMDQIIIDRGGSLRSLVERLRRERFDVAIVAYPRWRVAWALWRAGIPQRIGPASKPYSLLFSKRIWQHRSQGVKHEADYNLELLAPLGIPFKRVATRFILTPEERTEARKLLESMRINLEKPVVVLHPGSGGSSGRWPLTHFMELGDRLQEAGYQVVVTGGPGEDYQYIMIDNMRRIPVFIAAGSVSVRELAAVFSWMTIVVSNSTGPLHLAVALGVPTVSIYSPLPTCHPRRWGPYPDYAEQGKQHDVALAPLAAEEQADMAAVSVDQVWELCQKKLKLRTVGALPV